MAGASPHSTQSEQMITIRLTRAELEDAVRVGCRRRLWGIFHGNGDLYRAPADERWDRDIEGAAAEKAYAKWAGLPWDGSRGDDGDVGRAEVRATGHDYGCLLLHPPPRDKPHAPYVLLTGRAPLFTLRGWCWGRDGMKDEYWRDPKGNRPAWFVPQHALKPMVASQSLL